MAKLYKIELKKFTHKNHLFGGTVYLSGKKLGSWQQTEEGDEFDFDTSKIEKCMNEYKAKNKLSKSYNLHNFVEDLAKLQYMENNFKLSVKQGYPIMVQITDGKRNNVFGIRDIKNLKNKDYKNYISEIKKKFQNKTIMNVYTSLEDFQK